MLRAGLSDRGVTFRRLICRDRHVNVYTKQSNNTAGEQHRYRPIAKLYRAYKNPMINVNKNDPSTIAMINELSRTDCVITSDSPVELDMLIELIFS